MIVRCPACETEMDPTETSCPVCMRGRTRHEMMQGLQAPKKQARSRRRLVLGLLALAGAGIAAWQFRGELARRRPAPVPVPAQEEAKAAPESAPAVSTETASAPPAAGAAPETAIVATPKPDEAFLADLRSQLAKSPPAAGREPQAPAGEPPQKVFRNEGDEDYSTRYEGGDSPAEPAAPAAPVEGDWTIRGKVYELISLKPVPRARVVFSSKLTGKDHATRTDAKGAFTLKIPKLAESGYEIGFSAPGYRPDWLEEPDTPYSKQSLARCEEAAYQLGSSAILHVPYMPDPAHEEYEFNIVVFPRQ